MQEGAKHMSSGRRYRSPLDALVGSSVARIEERMNATNLIDLVRGLAAGMDGSGKPGPYRVTVPQGTNLGEHEEGENVSLEHRLKDIEGVRDVVVGTGLGTSIVQCHDERT